MTKPLTSPARSCATILSGWTELCPSLFAESRPPRLSASYHAPVSWFVGLILASAPCPMMYRSSIYLLSCVVLIAGSRYQDRIFDSALNAWRERRRRVTRAHKASVPVQRAEPRGNKIGRASSVELLLPIEAILIDPQLSILSTMWEIIPGPR